MTHLFANLSPYGPIFDQKYHPIFVTFLQIWAKLRIWFGVSKPVSSIERVLALVERGFEFESSQFQCSRENWVCLKFPWDKEFTDNCLIETRTKLEELIPAAMVKFSLNRVQLPLLQQSLINSFSWYGLSWAIVKCAEAAWNYKSGGVVHSALRITCGFLNDQFIYKIVLL